MRVDTRARGKMALRLNAPPFACLPAPPTPQGTPPNAHGSPIRHRCSLGRSSARPQAVGVSGLYVLGEDRADLGEMQAISAYPEPRQSFVFVLHSQARRLVRRILPQTPNHGRVGTLMRSGVYTITAPSGGQYVGSAVNFSKRWTAHRHHLRRGTHPNKALSSAAKKYGISGLEFRTIIVCRPDDVLMYEQLAIDALKPRYNSLRFAGHSTGWRHSEETRARISEVHTGRIRGPMSDVTKQKIRAAQVGQKRKPLEAWHVELLRANSKRAMENPEARANLSRRGKGRKLTAEHKAKIGAANKLHPISQACRDAAVRFQTGRKHSAETKAKRLASYLATVAKRNGL